MSKKEEFITLLESHVKIVYKVIHAYCKQEADKKDLEQEIVLQLWNSFDRYDPTYKFSTWMYKVALNTAVSYYRGFSKRKEQQYYGDYTSILNVIEEDEGYLEKEHNLQLLKRFIAELDDLNKAIMILYLEEKSHEEIGEIIGISKSNVGTKINRIKTKLKAEFIKHKK